MNTTKGSGNSVECPECGHKKGVVKDSRQRKAVGMVTMIRRRECLGCGHRFTTYELPAAVAKAAVSDLSGFAPVLRSVAAALEATDRETSR